MRRQARIVEADAGLRALIELDSISQCRRCSRGEGCGAAMLGAPNRGIQLWVTCKESVHAVAGQNVVLEIDEQGSGWLLAVCAAYGLPLLGLLMLTALATGIAGTASVGAELFIIVSALIGLCGGILAWRQLSPSLLARAERSLCLRSARIVAMYPSTEKERLDE